MLLVHINILLIINPNVSDKPNKSSIVYDTFIIYLQPISALLLYYLLLNNNTNYHIYQ